MKLSRSVTLVLVSVCVVVAAGLARADVRLPKIIGDHMVLQQGKPLPVWGWADAGEKVTVTVGESKATATADDDGKWMVKLDAMEAGGPCQMTVQGNNTITLEDILIGEVWVCSGQSNMQWPVTASDKPQEEIAAADYPNLRLFTVARKVAEKPMDDCEGSWAACSPQTVPGFSAVAYFFGRHLHKELDVPVGLINTSWGGTIAEAWMSHDGLLGEPDFEPILERAAQFNPKTPNQASNLYNGMLHPLIPFAIQGAIWYQGESNCTRAEQYRKLFPAMIQDWRKNWGQGEFAFLFVELAPFRYGWADPRCLPELWEAQFGTLELANTGMTVITDIGNLVDIHPKNKQEVGRRLALWALANTYGKDLVYSGPLYDSMTVEGDKIRIRFKHVGGGLVAKGQLGPFTIAGLEGPFPQFLPATATIDGDTVVVQSDRVKKPVAVRFGWFDTAVPGLFNKEGLPASPFRTDDFEMVTAGSR
jgi:sialate O-acetylesterase